MCELFGVSSLNPVTVNRQLREFARHSLQNPHGWGIAICGEHSVSVEKESVAALKSSCLQERLTSEFSVRNMIAHIRLATRGTMEWENCHPFVMEDNEKRVWTLAHNGTIFDCPILSQYVRVQAGQTDSERILCHIVASMNERQSQVGRGLTAEERFALMDELICEMAPHNKLNLLVYDGEQLYIHENYADSLYVRQTDDTAMFATTPLDDEIWKPVAFTTLLAYRDGKQIFVGTNHGFEYKDNPEDMRLIFLDYAAL